MPGRRRRAERLCQSGRRRRGSRLLLRPSILVLLLEKESYGYEIAEELTVQGVISPSFDSSIIYRDLRDLEEKGLIDSHWDEESKGPRRRVYTLNQQGRDCLIPWMENLTAAANQIVKLVDRYQDLVEPEEIKADG